MTEQIKKYTEKGYISFHTPAHKGRNEYLNNILKTKYDLTELPETDNLFNEEGCIKKMEEEMAQAFGGKVFYPLVNGAASGVTASLLVFNRHDKILVDRNCHISAVNGIILRGLKPVFIETTLNEFNIPCPPSVDNIKKAYIENRDAKGIFITSPNYYGMNAELDKIISFAEENNLISIVDRAHGSHYYYMDDMKTATECKADIVIMSFHKTLPSLTQTGGILFNNAMLADVGKNAVRMFTSTSPSYLLMMSVDLMNKYMQNEGKKLLYEINSYALTVKNKIAAEGISILTGNDPMRFVINCKDADKVADKIKSEYKIVCEMCDCENITYIISLHNYKSEIDLLCEAIIKYCKEKSDIKRKFILPEAVITPEEAFSLEGEYIPKNLAEGRISKECIIEFPPSVPIVMPGEKLTKNILEQINRKEIYCIGNNYVF